MPKKKVSDKSKRQLWINAIQSASQFFRKRFTAESILDYMPTSDTWSEEDIVAALARLGIKGRLVLTPLAEASHIKSSFILLCENKHYFISSIKADGRVNVVDEKGNSKEEPLNKIAKKYLGEIIQLENEDKTISQGINPFGEEKSVWFWSAFKSHLPIYSEVLVAALFVSLFALATPLFVMNVYDRVVPNAAFHTLWVLAIGLFIVVGFNFIMKKLKSDFIDVAAKRIDLKVSVQTFAQILDIKMANRLKSVGGMVSVVQSFESIRDFITSASISVLVDLPFIFIFLGVIFWLGGLIVIVPIVAIILSFLVSIAVQIPLRKIIGEYYKENGEKEAILIESLSSVETIKVTRAYGRFLDRWGKVTERSGKLGMQLRRLSNFATSFTASVQQLSTACVIIMGVYRIDAGLMTMGALIACTILTGRSLAPISQATGLVARFQQARGALRNLNKIMELPTELSRQESGISLQKLDGKIEFRNVSFTYPDTEVSVLNNISTRIKPGEKIGIIGAPGSGKTTFIKLLLKLYEPSDGQLLLDDLEIRQINTTDLRRFIGYVPQDVVLFNGSIRDNISIGADYALDEELVQAATLSGLLPYIQAHPEGFNWQVGEQGKCISGGQCQSVAIARALLLDPPLLILDEPTSDIDDTTTRQIASNIYNILPDKTLLMITHKLNLLQMVDRLMVFSKGNLVADGPKEEVLERLKAQETTGKVNIKSQKKKISEHKSVKRSL